MKKIIRTILDFQVLPFYLHGVAINDNIRPTT